MTTTTRNPGRSTVIAPTQGRATYSRNAAGALTIIALMTSPVSIAPHTTISDSGWPASGYAASPNVKRIVLAPSSASPKRESSHRRTPAQAVQDLHDQTGLTWDQIARFFGVSRRSVHSWAAGGRMSSANEEALIKTAALMDKLAGSGLDGYELRAELLRQMDSMRSSTVRDPETDINRPAQTWAEA